MKLTCNIDQRGRRARLVMGILTDTIGTAILVAGIVLRQTPLIVLGVIGMAAGGFMIFESMAGWCVVRALGFKTKL